MMEAMGILQSAGKAASHSTTTSIDDEEAPKPPRRRSKKVVPEGEEVVKEAKPRGRPKTEKVVSETTEGQEEAVEKPPKKKPGRKKKVIDPEEVAAAKAAKEAAKEAKKAATAAARKKKSLSLKNVRVSREVEQSMLRPCADPMQERLYDTGLWTWLDYGRWSAKTPSMPHLRGFDRSRAQVTSEKLVDDILEYIKPTLTRHEGCDIIDLNPGAGVWSTKLNDLLKPRSHLLLEPDAEFYKPMLEPLIQREGTKLIQKDGVIWTELLSVLTPEYLPHQKEHHYTADDVPERNDTLLVTANLGSYPKRKYASFASATAMILYQFNHAIRSGALFQKYGLVRMLIWMDDDDKAAVLPRMAQRRKRVAVDAEINCESITHVAGPDYSDGDPGKRDWFSRDVNIDRSSAVETLHRMQAAGIKTPPGRETKLLREIFENPDEVIGAGDVPITYDFRHQDELDQLERDFAAGIFAAGSAQHNRMVRMQVQVGSANRRNILNHRELESYSVLIKDWKHAARSFPDGSPEQEKALSEVMARYRAWEKDFLKLGSTANGDWCVQRDNLHLWQQKSMLWDRRSVEPLVVKAEEFFPHYPLSLIDIQPKAAHRVFRSMGRNSDRSGDMADVLMRNIMIYTNSPMSKVLDRLAPGAAEYVYPACKSFMDPERGGVPFPGSAEITVRGMSAWQYEDMMEQWMKWPFKPSLEDLIGQLSDEYKEAEEDGGSGKYGGVTPEF